MTTTVPNNPVSTPPPGRQSTDPGAPPAEPDPTPLAPDPAEPTEPTEANPDDGHPSQDPDIVTPRQRSAKTWPLGNMARGVVGTIARTITPRGHRDRQVQIDLRAKMWRDALSGAQASPSGRSAGASTLS